MSRPPEAQPRQRLLPNVLLSLAVTVLFAGGLEGVARLLESHQPSTPPVADYISDWEKKWHGEFYIMQSSAVGWPPWEKFNGDGVRDRSHALEKPQGVKRVVCLGDSVTLGYGIRSEEAFPQVLQEVLDERGPGVEVFNVALSGWSSRQQRTAYRRIARKYQPDHVLLGICLNDVAELQNNLARPPAWLSLLHRRSALVRRVVDAPGREIRNVEEMLEQPNSPTVQEGFARLFLELTALRDEVGADGASLSVAIFPFRFQLASDAPPATAQTRIATFCESSGIPHIDLLPALRERGSRAFHDYDHLSPEGARLVAGTLERSRLLPRPIPAAATLAQAIGLQERPGARVPAWLHGETAAPPPEGGVHDLVRGLAHERLDVRRSAAWALGRIGPGAGGAAAALTELLKDPEEPARAEAAGALGKLGDAGRVAVPSLFEALEDERQRVRWQAARALWRLQPAAPEAAQPLARALESRDRYVRAFAAWTLGQSGPAAASAVPALIEALRHEEAYGRAGAALALGRMGPAARQAIPALLPGLEDADGHRRWRTAQVLGRIGVASDGAVDALLASLEDSDARVRAQAAKALGRIGPDATAAAEALTRATSDADASVRHEALEALRRISG